MLPRLHRMALPSHYALFPCWFQDWSMVNLAQGQNLREGRCFYTLHMALRSVFTEQSMDRLKAKLHLCRPYEHDWGNLKRKDSRLCTQSQYMDICNVSMLNECWCKTISLLGSSSIKSASHCFLIMLGREGKLTRVGFLHLSSYH